MIYKWYICQLGDYMPPIPPFRGTRNNHGLYMDTKPVYGIQGILGTGYGGRGLFSCGKKQPKSDQVAQRGDKTGRKNDKSTNRWWFQTCLIFIPTWGRLPFLTNIFQMGWFNHQLDSSIFIKVLVVHHCYF